DPVENASLLPWLTATAFLHSVMIQEKRGMLKQWNILLVLGTFLLSVFATFLTRSGLIESVHSFAQNLNIAWIFLGFMGAATLVCGTLVYLRRDRLMPENQLESFVSREAAFIGNNLLFVGAMFAVLWGTLFPLISEGLLGQKIAVGPPFFNRVTIPMGLMLLFLLGIGPIIAWRKATPRNLQRNFVWPLAVGAAVGVGFFVEGVRNTQVILTFALGAFTLATVFVEFRKGTRARASIEGEGLGKAFVHLIERNRRRYGGYVVHVGLVVMFMGFAGRAYTVEKRVALLPGESMEIASPFGHTYRLTYLDMSWYEVPNALTLTASMQVEKDGVPVGVLTAEQLSFRQRQEMNTDVGIRRVWNEDLYLILAAIEDPNGFLRGTNPRPLATFTVLVNPLVPWIWTGGLIMAFGTLVAMWPTGAGAPAERTPEVRASRRKRELVEV
ncbi:MAG: cytochrome c biogenesis protein CcsA, partial [Gemmatimonadota bacterium]|nr:cytochrome c biogenesis protein CcsA [Gemmatimonadota bacterium]